MATEEESTILAQTGCSPGVINVLLNFADKYRSRMTSDAVQKNRKLGTRALRRLASRLAKFPADSDLRTLLSQAILAEFLPPTESMNLDIIFDECIELLHSVHVEFVYFLCPLFGSILVTFAMGCVKTIVFGNRDHLAN